LDVCGDGRVDCSSKRLGYLIQQSRQVFQIQNVVAGMATIGLVGYVMSASLERLERNVNAWAPAER
jgi:NitT/TauT family transport system permease protein/sulfonate transport system permease protein